MAKKKTGKTTSKSRIAHSGKGKDAKAVRNKDGVAVTPKQYKPGEVEKGKHDIAEYYAFNIRQLEWLRVYAQSLDPKEACQETGVPKKTLDNWMMEDKFKMELMEIFEVYKKNIKMTAENSAAKLIGLMEKFEKDYDGAENVKEKSMMAKPLASMADSYLRAAGHFQHGGQKQDSNVVINIDLGGDPENEKRVSINGEKGDGSD